MRPVYPHTPDSARSAKLPAADRWSTNPSYSFVLSRCLGSSSYFSLWLLEGTSLLEHWMVLADGAQGLQHPNIFLLQSSRRLLPAAHYDEGPCQLLPLHREEADDLADQGQTIRQALAKGCVTLRLDGQRLQGCYLLQRVGAGRGHTWQLTFVSRSVLQKAS